MLILTLLLSLPPIAPSSADIRPLMIGQKIPDATLKNIDGKDVKLHELIKEKPVVLVYYRGGWCPYCNLQLSQLRQTYPVLQQIGYELVAVSPDPLEALQKTVQRHELKYTLLSDEDYVATRGFGLAFKTADKDFGGIPGLAKRKPVLPVPAVYLVAKGGRIIYQYVNIDFAVRLSGEVLLTAAKAYRTQ